MRSEAGHSRAEVSLCSSMCSVGCSVFCIVCDVHVAFLILFPTVLAGCVAAVVGGAVSTLTVLVVFFPSFIEKEIAGNNNNFLF